MVKVPEALGNIYQISNQRTMGTSEEDTN
ncbi:MAG: hypothetical protein ACLUPK_08510 [Veillonella sp.]